MKIESVLLFALVIGAYPLAAQYAKVPPMQESFGVAGMEGMAGAHKLVAVPAPAANRCPISMRAQHLSDGSLMKAGGARHAAGIGQRLHLTLGNPRGQKIASAGLAVHGYTPKGRLMQASPMEGGGADATRSLTISFSAGEGDTVSADLWVPGMTAVQSIEVKSVTYADGSTWKLTE